MFTLLDSKTSLNENETVDYLKSLKRVGFQTTKFIIKIGTPKILSLLPENIQYLKLERLDNFQSLIHLLQINKTLQTLNLSGKYKLLKV